MKHVWVKSATCERTASTTRGAALPMLVTAMPAPRSISRLPSTSSTIPPAARAAYTGMTLAMPRDTAAPRRLLSCTDAGPGISVTRWRVCSTAGTSGSLENGVSVVISSLGDGNRCGDRDRVMLAVLCGLRSRLSRYSAGGPTPSGRHTLVVGSHHCPGSQPSGVGPIPNGLQMFPLGSHHCPGSQPSGVGPTPNGRQVLLNGSQYCPASHCAELTGGVAIVVTAIGVNA